MKITAVLLVLMLLHSTAAAQQVLVIPPQQCMDAESRDRIRAIILDGIDQALKQHAVRMYDNWIKDPADQPARARRGLRNAVSAYLGARTDMQKWSPEACK